MKLLEWQSKFLQSKSKGSGSEECKITSLLFRQVRKEIDKARTGMERLEKEASKAAAFAANSAGRLEEFITVFANAKNSSNGFCLGNGKAATPKELKDCFSGTDFREKSLVDISERVSEQEPNLDSKIEGIKHQSLRDSLGGGNNVGFNLTKGTKGGILKRTKLENSLWWGGGILSIGKGFDGNLGSSQNFGAGEIANNTKEGKHALWTENPATHIVHLKNASDAFKTFKAVQEKIKEKVESIEQQIQACMRDQESGENNTEQNATKHTTTTEQTPTSLTCFDNVVKIAAYLKEKRALLARYQKVKEWIPPNSDFNTKIAVTLFGILLTLF
ncbi:unnamed protein product [Trypanosoma congolense IL3000]|uniref:WGS project CAEQ00000000 data, annotated contig 1317 n=1 Tax=Trypanosoma congolense (strain IL3000) TaxID=1068625 RepID=F9W5E0_TRYCI|nr:unnamed protein product [Trypanosoma congolense IL3000]